MSWLLLGLLGCSIFADAPMPEAVAAVPAPPKSAKVRTKTVVSKPYHIDKKYASMRGPYGFDDVVLWETEEDKGPELLWIVGYRTTVVDADSGDELSQEYMCHANLDFEAKDYYDKFPTSPPVSGRVFTLSQGQQDIKFPEGFGIPVTSDLAITLATQVLNLNQPKIDVNVRHRVEVDFVRDVEVEGEMVALFQGAVEGFKALEEARHYGYDPEDVDPETHGPGCSVGQAAVAGDSDDDHLGQKFTAHWVVPPGKETNITNVSKFLNLPYDTEAHYIAVHLHPFAENLVLKDLTTDEVVFDSKVTGSANRIGIDRVEYYTSRDGIKLYKGHQYELVSNYNNTSGENVDSMAVMYLYMRDREFEKPTL